MHIKLADDRREAFILTLQGLFQSEFDQNLSKFHAEQVLDLFLKSLGPTVYNQAVQDVRAHLQARLDDLDGEVYADSE
jgi:uncharacterized protein (DUF2164 family)